MLKTDIKQSFRQMRARKMTAIIQVLGLGIGLGSVIVMLALILHEFSFDRYHKNSSSIYRVIQDKNCSTPYILGETFKAEIPEIKNTFRIYAVWNTLLKQHQEFVKIENFILADSSIFSMLDIPVIAGNIKFLHQSNNDVVISDKAALKYFGNADPIGQPMEFSISGKLVSCNVSGVFKHFPSNSSMQADFIGSNKLKEYVLGSHTLTFSTGNVEKKELDSWALKEFQTFVLTDQKSNLSSIEKKATLICQKNDKDNGEKQVHLQPFTGMYFHSGELWNYEPFKISNIKIIRLFEGIALLLLLIAWFNYILLSTAETKSQLKELACRKVIGASPGQIARKAYVHSLIMAALSLLPALLFTNLIIPLFNQLFDKNIDVTLLLRPEYMGAVLMVTIVTGLAGGSYITFYTNRLKPANLLKPLAGNRSSGGFIPAGSPIVFQFVVFILLLSSAILIDKQVRYAEGKSQGFNSNHVLIFRLNDGELKKNVLAIKSKLESNSHVVKVATSAFTPPSSSFIQLSLGKDKNSEPLKEEGMFVGTELIDLLQVPILEGSNFSVTTGSSNEILINELAARKHKVKAGDLLGNFRVKGILRNFHLHSLHKPINPVFIVKMNDESCNEMVVRSDGNDKEVIAGARKIWSEIAPATFFEYKLLNDRISSFYDDEKKQSRTISFFSFLAIFLSVMGLFGYVSITLLKRTKEIGVRKVNGARVSEILTMLNKDFIKWIAIAFIIACPIAWYAMHKWLQNFAYKTELSWWVFGLAGIVAVAVALLTVIWQSWKAATRNPVESLRYE
jgi:putative ABC transport system permease protein